MQLSATRLSAGVESGRSTKRRAIAGQFASGRLGWWRDPSDLSTMRQSYDGTGAAAVDQPVAILLDKSQGLALGSELKSTGVVSTVGASTAATYDASTGSGTVYRTDVFNQSGIRIPVPNGMWVQITLTVAAGSTIHLRNGGISSSLFANGLTAGTYQLFGFSAVDVTGTWVSITSGGGPAQFTLSSIRTIAGNHFYEPTAPNRPTLRQTAGGLYYLEYNGSNSIMRSNAINYGGATAVTMFAGVRKISDASPGMVMESGSLATDPGCFSIRAPNSTGAPNYAISGTGTLNAAIATPSSFAAPHTSVLGGVIDIAAGRLGITVNTATQTTIAGNFGTGTIGNNPIHIGRRLSSGPPALNGYEYGSCCFAGRLTDAEYAAVVRELAGKSGVTL